MNRRPSFLSRSSIHFVSYFLLLVAVSTQASRPVRDNRLPISNPAKVGISGTKLKAIDVEVEREIQQKHLPGAVVLVAREGHIVWRKAYGARAVEPSREAMTVDTIFDLASLTKVVATATSIMILVERGKVRLNDPLSTYIPEIKGEGREQITLELLLTHRAGYAPDFDLRDRWSGSDEAINRLKREPLRNPPGAKFVYSDINYIALGEVVHRASGLTLDEFARQNIFRPLGMRETGFQPEARLRPRIAPTEKRRGQLSYLGDKPQSEADIDKWLRGEVHDPTSFRMSGVAGHAGLFSTADDLAIYCQMILNGGEYRGARILSPLSVAEMTRPRLVSEAGWTRGVGWDINTSFSTNRGDLFPPGSFGHTGFTGTSIWIDPTTNMYVVFLSNRVHPDGKGDVGPLRGRVASIAAGSITSELALVGKARAEWSRYYETLTADLGRFTVSGMAAQPQSAVVVASEPVLTGIDVLERDNFKQLAGMRVGLVTNHTGRDRQNRSTIDVFYNAPNVKLVALFAPEHGIRGLADDKVSDTKDEKTGLPIYSLYGETRRPTPEQLKDLDALVFDIQDVGARFYTYISTLGNLMEEAGKAKLPVFVLDRPNPIGGIEVDGPIADADKLSFVVYHQIPVRHGMTIGELAKLFNQERNFGCDLKVIELVGWRRSMWLDETNLVWINPSPNMRSLNEATLYTGVGLLETTNISVGRGTDTPFEVLGAPWIDGPQLAARLNRVARGGVRFVPIRFTPSTSVYKGEECSGVNLIVTDRVKFRPVLMGLQIAMALRELYPQWKIDSSLRLLANADTLARLKRGETEAEIVSSWSAGLDEFKKKREKVLIYQ